MDCTDAYIDVLKHINSMLRVSGVLIGLPIVEISGHTDNALNCDNNHLKFEDLLRLSIGVDACGKPALRVKFIASCDLNKTCSNNDVQDNLRQIFAYDSTEKTFALVINKSV